MTFTQEQLIEYIKGRKEFADECAADSTLHPERREYYKLTAEALRIALASLEAEPVVFRSKLKPPSAIGSENWDYTDHRQPDAFELESCVIERLYTAPPAPVVPAELHPDTQKLVTDFCTALAEKLYKAQLKYGYDADWKQDGWPTQCQAHFHQHIAKGDSRDVATYCAFMWYHGWKTEPAPVSVPDAHYQNLSELYHAQEKRLFKLAQRIKGPSFDKYAHSPSQAIDVLESAIFGEREDDCRAAMLQGAGVTENCRSSEKAQVVKEQLVSMKDHQIRELVNELRDIAIEYHGAQQLRERIARTIREAMLHGAEPVTTAYKLPEGWVAVPVEPTMEILDEFDSIIDHGAEDSKEAWSRLIAAAPQQEVK